MLSKCLRLHVACDRGHLKLVQLLLSAAADPNAAAADGSTPLHVAAAVDNADVVRLLLAAGAVSCIAFCDPPPSPPYQSQALAPTLPTVTVR